jgi:hypothetical protein
VKARVDASTAPASVPSADLRPLLARRCNGVEKNDVALSLVLGIHVSMRCVAASLSLRLSGYCFQNAGK